MNRRWFVLGAQAFDTTLPAREAHPRLRRVWAAASACSLSDAGVPRFGDALRISISKFAMDPPDRIRPTILRHEERYLVSLVEIIEIHELLPSS
jgi:hypothetical protein